MADKIIHCPNCQSDNLNSFDNEPLEIIPREMFEGKNISRQYDPEIYLKFKCHNCEHEFTKTFDLVPQKTIPKLILKKPTNLLKLVRGWRIRVNHYWHTGSSIVTLLEKPKFHEEQDTYIANVVDKRRNTVEIYWDKEIGKWEF